MGIGTVYGLSDAARLTLANAVTAYYISNPEGKHPARKSFSSSMIGLSTSGKPKQIKIRSGQRASTWRP